MIRISKGEAPRKLAREGRARSMAHRREYDADPAAFVAGASTFAFAPGIYAHRSVRDALERAQHGKCCYCEARLDRPYAHFHVDHWRPKARVRQCPGGEELRPGYYWLAYEWDNLLLSCHFCNSANKGDLFPLADPNGRARNHGADLAIENPLLLKPDGPEDPHDHIGFRADRPFGKTPKGRATVAALGLAEKEHVVRQRLLIMLRTYRDIVRRYEGDPTPAGREFTALARGHIESALRPEAPFSAMANAFVASDPLGQP